MNAPKFIDFLRRLVYDRFKQPMTKKVFLIVDNYSVHTAGEVKAQMLADFPGYEEYQSGDTGVSIIKTVQNSNAAIYNLAGQKVSNDFKGIVIQNGRKMIQK